MLLPGVLTSLLMWEIKKVIFPQGGRLYQPDPIIRLQGKVPHP